jgi:hypothetical protein
MLVRKHPDARCPRCAAALWYGLKREATGWKVQYVCRRPDGCGREFTPARIPNEDARSEDEAYRRAERIGAVLY